MAAARSTEPSGSTDRLVKRNATNGQSQEIDITIGLPEVYETLYRRKLGEIN